MKNIAVVGAGWTGIGVLRILLEKGYKVDLYEQKDDIGGTWHPTNCYAGLRSHDPAYIIEYFDFPLHNNIDKSKRLTSIQIFDYLKSYCKFKNLYQNMKFNIVVKKISYNSHTKKSVLFIMDSNSRQTSYTKEYDYIVYTNGFSNKNIPHFNGIENFKGTVLHSFDFNEELMKSLISKNTRMIVLGASKTATDLIYIFSKYAYKVIWLYRKAYWFLKYENKENLIKQELLNKKQSYFLKLKVLLPRILGSKTPGVGFRILKLLNIIHTYGKNNTDFRKFHNGNIDTEQMKILKDYNQYFSIEGEISKLENYKVYLKDGREIETDVIICCTGSGSNALSLVEIDKDNTPLKLDKIKNVYRSKVIPEIPNLIFTAYHMFSAGVSNGLITGNWIAKFIELNPNENYLYNNAVMHSYPFFLKNILFSSDEYIYTEFNARNAPFLLSGELSKDDLKNNWNHFSAKVKKPMDFNFPIDRSKTGFVRKARSFP